MFRGDFMNWNSFWTAFFGTIENDDDLSDIEKLTYLMDCTNADTSLFKGVDHTRHYDQVVAELCKHYDKPKKVHSVYCKRITESSPIANTSKDLMNYANQINHIILGLQALKSYNIESVYTALALQCLPPRLTEQWDEENA